MPKPCRFYSCSACRMRRAIGKLKFCAGDHCRKPSSQPESKSWGQPKSQPNSRRRYAEQCSGNCGHTETYWLADLRPLLCRGAGGSLFHDWRELLIPLSADHPPGSRSWPAPNLLAPCCGSRPWERITARRISFLTCSITWTIRPRRRPWSST